MIIIIETSLESSITLIKFNLIKVRISLRVRTKYKKYFLINI